MALDIDTLRRQFPALRENVAYLDSAATAQVPDAVITAMAAFERGGRSNVRRGLYPLAEAATAAYESARQRVAVWLHAQAHEIIFTKNGTEALNLVARSWGDANLTKHDTVLVSVLEHHSNIVPWLQVRERTGCRIEWIDCDDTGNLNLETYHAALAGGAVKCVSLTGQSNVLGIRPPLREMIAAAHDAGAIVVVDACQLAAHAPIDVADLDCDFLACTGHKIYGPTGIGVLNGKRALLEAAPPFLGGGMMIHEVKSEGFTPAEIPHKFEAGTPPVTQAVGLAAAIDWQEQWSWKDRATHERMLMETALDRLGSIVDLHILGPANVNECFGCVSFTVGNVHPHDIAEIAGREGVCLRAGHHCCQPLHKRLGVAASTRLSFGLYNTVEEVERAVAVIQSAIKRFS